MPTPTYTLIQEQVLTSPASSVTFTSIPQTYKDLVLEIVGGVSIAGQPMLFRLNGDSASNYSYTELYGDGSAAGSVRASNLTYGNFNNYAAPNGNLETVATAHFMSYSNTTTNKTVIGRSSRATANNYPGADAIVNLWRSTAAITSITLSVSSSGNYVTGSTFRLYGLVG